MIEAPDQPGLPGPAWRQPRMLVSIGAGALYGLAMRIGFAFDLLQGSGGGSGVMMASFVFGVPLLIGAIAVYTLPAGRRTITASLVAPLLPVGLFVSATALLLLEGSICIFMALPIFLFMGVLGGLLTGLALKAARPRPATFGALLALPLASGLVERDLAPADHFGRSAASVHIDAAPEAIWRLINDARAIRPEEMRDGLAWRIGVPLPLEAVTVGEGAGRVRKLRWERGVHFDEPILDWEENRFIRWRYVFAPDSVPPGALDDHVAIGGRHFDLVDTSYRLTPEAGGTRLDIEVNYRVSTNFNAYAGAWAEWLIDDAAETILAFYRRRAEAEA